MYSYSYKELEYNYYSYSYMLAWLVALNWRDKIHGCSHYTGRLYIAIALSTLDFNSTRAKNHIKSYY